MSSFQYQTQDMTPEGGTPALLVQLSGSVDPTSILDFEKMLSEVLQGKNPHVIMDLKNVAYINSTGFEKMIHEVDGLNQKGGSAVLLQPPPKVAILIETLGLDRFFHVAQDMPSALATVAGNAASPPKVQMRLKGAAGKPPPESSATRVMVPSAPLPSPGAGKRIVHCKSCATTLTVGTKGRYRCPHCRAMFVVDDVLTVREQAETAACTVEISIPADEEYIEAMRLFLSLEGSKAGLDPERIVAVSHAAETCGRILIQEALGGNSAQRVHILLEAFPTLFSVRLYAAGKPLHLENRDLSRREDLGPLMTQVDRIAFEPSGGGNLFVIEKNSA
jgi:anti-anti-sigma factor